MTEAIGVMFGYPIQVEIEKICRPMIYLNKKCYAAVMCEHPADKGKLDVERFNSSRVMHPERSSAAEMAPRRLRFRVGIMGGPPFPYRGSWR